MKRRFGLIVTRLAILALIVMAVMVGRDAMMRQLLISKAQSWLGAKVEIAQFNSSFKESKLYLRDLAIADPRDPMLNLIQAESATLQIDLEQLARKRLVVKDGNASRVMFATPRSYSGELNRRHELDGKFEINSQLPKQPFVLSHEPTNAKDNWLDSFRHTSGSRDVPSLKIVETSNRIFEQWNLDLSEHQDHVNELKKTLREINDLVAFDTNPLRNKHLEKAETLLGKLESEIQTLTQGLVILDQKVVEDRNLLVQSKSEDNQILFGQAKLKQLSGETLSQILLFDYQLARIQEILNWYFAFQEFVPNPDVDFLSESSLGKYWPLAGYHPVQSMHIKKIRLDGEGRIAGNSFNFSGAAHDIVSNPSAFDVPTTFELRAQGKAHAFVNCTLDRRDGKRNDTLQISCPDLPLDARVLGNRQNLSVNVSPCRTNVEMNLQSRDGRLNGMVVFDHSNLIMQIEHLDPSAGGIDVARQINLELASISGYRVSTTIGGTVDRPFVAIESNLGDRLAVKFNQVLNSEIRAAENQIKTIYEASVVKLDSEIADRIRQITQSLQNDVVAQHTRVAEDLNARIQGKSLDRKLIR